MTYFQIAAIGAAANAVMGIALLSPFHLVLAAVVATVLWATRA